MDIVKLFTASLVIKIAVAVIVLFIILLLSCLFILNRRIRDDIYY